MKRIFVHIPKNGGMTIRKGIGGSVGGNRVLVATEKHHISSEYTAAVVAQMERHNEHHGKEHARWRDWRVDLREQYPAFAVVRNPWSRTVSRYTFMMYVINSRLGSYERYQPCSFEEFLEQRHEWGGVDYFWHRAIHNWYPQKDYVVDDSGILRCDCLRFATDDVQNYLGLSAPLAPRNVSNGRKKGGSVVEQRDYREFYGSEERKIIEEWYAEDIEFFGFSFGSGATKNIWGDHGRKISSQ